MEIVCEIDVVNAAIIKGWAISLQNQENHVFIEVYIDNDFVGSGEANKYREDLGSAGFSSLDHGYEILFNNKIQTLKPVNVQLYAKAEDSLLLIKEIETVKLKNSIVHNMIYDDNNKKVYGWIFDIYDVDAKVNAELIINGVNRIPFIANKSQDDLFLLGKISNENGFVVDIENISGRNLLELIYDGQVLERKIVNISNSVVGYVDKYENGSLIGWAANSHSLNKTINCNIYINKIMLATCAASESRKDLEKLGADYINHGFIYYMPFNPDDNDNRLAVDVVTADSKYEIVSNLNEKTMMEKIAFKSRCSIQNYIGNENFYEKITIIVPVYNAYDELYRCVKSISKYTNSNVSILFVDDASSDPRIWEYLSQLKKKPNVKVIRNESNRGYTKTINRGIRLAKRSDVILLNSDTEVTPRWVENLYVAAYSRPNIGTVTALSDNAGAFSVPRIFIKNQIPAWLNKESYARLVSQSSLQLYPETPTGNGFCMYVKRELFQSIGCFDEESFPRGYGEENDFCMRAIHQGWSNIICDNVIIYHARSASFKDEKNRLISDGQKKLQKKYPEYHQAVKHCFQDSHMLNTVRYRINRGIRDKEKSYLPRILFVISSESGGTPKTNSDLMQAISDLYEPMLLTSDEKTVKLYCFENKNKVLLESYRLKSPIQVSMHISTEYDAIVFEWLCKYSVEILHVRHIGRHSLNLVSVAKKILGLPVVFSFHDFYSICPNVKLLDADLNFCEGVCTDSVDDCSIELFSNKTRPPLKHKWVHTWRQRQNSMLSLCDIFVSTSTYTKELINKFFPTTVSKTFKVIPHGRDFEDYMTVANPVISDNKPIKILVAGHITKAKGFDLWVKIKALDIDNLLEIHVLGDTPGEAKRIGVMHGKYDRSQFLIKVKDISPHIGAILSVWPETYCHTLTEMWAAGLPVLTTNFGALFERMNNSKAGWLVDTTDEYTIYNEIIRIKNNPYEINDKLFNVLKWQLETGSRYTVKSMASEYLNIYDSLLNSKTTFNYSTGCLVWVINLDSQIFKIRNISQYFDCLSSHLAQDDFIIRRMTIDDVICAELSPPEVIIFQINTFAPFSSKLVERLEQRKLNGLITIVDFMPDCSSIISLVKNTNIIEPNNFQSVHEFFSTLSNLVNFWFTVDGSGIINIIDIAELKIKISNYACNRRQVAPSIQKFSNNELINEISLDWKYLLAKSSDRKKNHVSIIILNFNRAEMTTESIKSILNITKYNCYDIIVVDNGSDCEDSSFLSFNVSKLERVKLINLKNNFMFSLGNNIGFSHSTGQFALFLNNDTLIHNENWLDMLMSPFSDPSIGIVGGKLLYPDLTLQAGGIVFNNISKFPYHIYKNFPSSHPAINKFRRFQAVTGACLAIRACDFIKLKGFSPIFNNGCEDIDLCFRTKLELSKDVVYQPEAQLIHYESKSPDRGKYNLENRKRFIEIWDKHIYPDDIAYYSEDNFLVESYSTDDLNTHDSLSVFKPKLIDLN